MTTDDIAAFLAAQGFGVYNLTANSSDSTIFTDFEPAAPATMIAVLGYAGEPIERGAKTFDAPTTPQRETPRIQVVCRDPSQTAAKAQSYKVYLALLTINQQVLTTTFYYAVTPLQTGPTPLGQDKKGWWRYSLNYACRKALSVVA